MSEGNLTAPGWYSATIDVVTLGVAMGYAEGK
jgi:hypothetical protein